MSMVPLLLLLLCLVHLNNGSPPPEPVTCSTNKTFNCTIANAYDSFVDGSTCHAANVVYPSTEKELLAAVAAAAASKRKVKVATKYSHSVPRLACPGGHNGTIISTLRLNRTVRVDAAKRLVTVEAGMVLEDLIRLVGEAGLSLHSSPYWYGLTVGGLLATGAHGSSLWGKGGAVHEYVVGMRIVTPAPASQGYAVVRDLDAGHPDLDAAKVSLGVLGVVSQVTFALEPLFKRTVTFVKRDESDLPSKVSVWGHLHEFGDIKWLLHEGTVIYREDDRVDVSTPGDGLFNLVNFRSLPTRSIVANRVEAERLEKNGTDADRCRVASRTSMMMEQMAYGFTNDGANFTGYPVVGYQHRMQASGECIHSPEDALQTSCAWDPRVRGQLSYNSGFSLPLSRAPAFLADVRRLRDLNPSAICALDATAGLFMRYVKASSAFLGKAEDAVDFDIVFYWSSIPGTPRAHADVIDEIEQMALLKYGGVPHWGKSRDFAFEGVIARYPRAARFLEVKDRYDPDGIFSSEWSDQVLGIRGSPSVVRKRCAIDGLCICSDDSHCAPELGYFCRPGKVFTEARVCASHGYMHNGTLYEP